MLNQSRVIIEHIHPELDGGTHPITCIVDEIITVTADILADGHDVVAAHLKFRHEKSKTWKEVRMVPMENDRWTGSFQVEKQGFYEYKIEAWVDYALNWQHGIHRKIDDQQKVTSELLEGVEYIDQIIGDCGDEEVAYLKGLKSSFNNEETYDEAISEAVSDRLHHLFATHPKKHLSNESHVLRAYCDRLKARFSTWYEFFPRSASPVEGQHGTFKDCEALLPRVAKMGFDTLYFPPVHPIGVINRKGKNNTTVAKEGDVGSCWGIGSALGGHKDIHPELGTVDDFKSLVQKAKELNIEIAMDFALQAAPDHPWVKEHPDWFKWRPDGTVQYAENPPKKYQDILPIYFESSDWKNLWKEMLATALYWVEECDIQVFRVDNPHTKPFYFWGWLIAEVKKRNTPMFCFFQKPLPVRRSCTNWQNKGLPNPTPILLGAIANTSLLNM